MPDPQARQELPSWAQRLLTDLAPPLVASHAPPALTPPRQTGQPPLAASHAQALPPGDYYGPQEPPTPPSAWTKAATIGAPQLGEHYPAASLPELLGSDNPARLVGEYLAGPGRPRAVANQDPIGIETFHQGKGPPPVMGATIEEVGAPLTAAARGLYSRVEDVAGQVPAKGMHPNKLASLLKSGASQEEVAHRNLPAFLSSKGNALVTPEELRAHLGAHPAPFPGTTVLGGSHENEYNAFIDRMEQRYGRGYSVSEHLTPAEQQEQARLWRQVNEPGGDRNLATKYQSYTLPGGENYRESLYTLQPKQSPPSEELAGLYRYRDQLDSEMRVAAAADPLGEPGAPLIDQWHRLEGRIGDLQRREAAAQPQTYRSGHFNQPNILAHARTTERTLPVEGMRSLPEIESIIQDVVGAKRPEHIASGGPGMAVRQGLITHDEAALYGQSKGFTNYPHAPTGSRGRFIEEIQSDWHQAGKRQGYVTAPAPGHQQRLAQLQAEIERTRQQYFDLNHQRVQAGNARLDRQREITRSLLPPEFANLTSFNQALQGGPEATAAWRAARDATHPATQELVDAEALLERQAERMLHHNQQLQQEEARLVAPKGVPDAPFKDTWPDLALKQQLLDVARDPHTNWLGFTGGKSQAERYDLSKQVSKLSFEPDTAHDFSVGHLVAHDLHGDEVMRQRVEPHEFDAHIGKEPADALRRKIAEHEQSRDYERAQWSVERDPDIPDRFYIFDPNGEPMHDYAGRLERFRHEDDAHARIDDLLRGDQEQHGVPPSIEGLDLQVGGEGMKHFYDNLLPSRLRKLLKPFGGTVEPFNLPTSKKTMDIDVPAFSVRDQHGNMRGIWENRADAEAYLANAPDFIDAARSTIVPATTVRQQQVPHTEPSWIARLSPEMKAAILRRGFPLLSLAPILGPAALEALRQGQTRDHLGAPPPAPPAPR